MPDAAYVLFLHLGLLTENCKRCANAAARTMVTCPSSNVGSCAARLSLRVNQAGVPFHDRQLLRVGTGIKPQPTDPKSQSRANSGDLRRSSREEISESPLSEVVSVRLVRRGLAPTWHPMPAISTIRSGALRVPRYHRSQGVGHLRASIETRVTPRA